MGAEMKTLILIVILAVSNQAWAFDKEDTTLSFRDALLQSNSDYNKSKKKVLDQENERIDQWGEREVAAIAIGQNFDLDNSELESDIEDSHTDTFTADSFEAEDQSDRIPATNTISMND